MKQFKRINRRKFLRYAGAGSAIALANPSLLLGATTAPLHPFVPDLEIALTAMRSKVSLLPGKPTRVYTYRTKVLKGDPASVQPLPGSYLGPIIRIRRGQKIRVHGVGNVREQEQQSQESSEMHLKTSGIIRRASVNRRIVLQDLISAHRNRVIDTLALSGKLQVR